MTDIHRRRSVRLKGYDYGLPRAYFVTLNTWQRACLFGEIVGGEMRLSPVGKIVVDELRRFGRRYPDWRLDAFVVMPNHVHMIVVLTKGVGATRHAPAREMAGEGHGPEQLPHGEDGSPIGGAAEGVGATRHAPVRAMAGEGGEPERLPHGEDGSPVQGIAEGRPRGPASGSLGMVIGQFKSRLTKCLRAAGILAVNPIWQRNYYEHIIRNDAEWERIRLYIRENPRRWEEDREYGPTR